MRTKAHGTSNSLAYLITFTCYGTRLHGNDAGSVDRKHNVPGTPFLPPKPSWVRADERQMKEKPYELDKPRRDVVLQALREVCSRRGWNLFAAQVRSRHAHFVVSAQEAPEKVLNDVKAYASRSLNRTGLASDAPRRWSRHGSTRYLWKREQVGAAIHYVVREQGEPLAVWENPTGLF
ncbi:MAG: transposase [Acidobacteria bacterium]|nr:transposase [Acidobacteriota bacterium]